jgi:hypothetical protein
VLAAFLADASTWSWFPNFKDGSCEGDTRRVRIGRYDYVETILVRDGSAFAFRVDETSAPYAKALVEEWRAEPHPDGTLARWTFTADPAWFMRLPGVKSFIGATFRRAMRNLEAQLT